MANNLSYDFVNYAPKDLGVFTENILQVLPANPLFDRFKEEIDGLKTLYPPFWSAYLAALKGGSDRIAERNACEDELVLQLLVVAFIVESKAVRNPAIVAETGYKSRKQSSASSTPVEVFAPTNFVGEDVKTRLGAAELWWKGSEGSVSYNIESRLKGTTDWSNRKHTTRQSIVLDGFPSGSYVEFRVSANGTGVKTSDWSVIVTVLVS
jgi:hypothetical protein